MDPTYPQPQQPVPTPLPSQPAPPSRSHRKRFIVVAVVITLVALSAGIAYAILTSNPKCFSGDDYKALTSKDPDDQASFEGTLYTAPLTFAMNTTTYSNATAASDQAIVQRIGAFYKAHADRKPSITLSGSYEKVTGVDLVAQRYTKVKNDLIAAGVTASAIKTATPSVIVSGGETLDTTTSLESPVLYITISSNSSCRQA